MNNHTIFDPMNLFIFLLCPVDNSEEICWIWRSCGISGIWETAGFGTISTGSSFTTLFSFTNFLITIWKHSSTSVSRKSDLYRKHDKQNSFFETIVKKFRVKGIRAHFLAEMSTGNHKYFLSITRPTHWHKFAHIY